MIAHCFSDSGTLFQSSYVLSAATIVHWRNSVPGVGPGLSPERTRMLLALRINILAKGYSGISKETLQQYIDAFNGESSLGHITHHCHANILPSTGHTSTEKQQQNKNKTNKIK